MEETHEDEYSVMSLEELQEEAQSRGISTQGLSRDDLHMALHQHDKEQAKT